MKRGKPSRGGFPSSCSWEEDFLTGGAWMNRNEPLLRQERGVVAGMASGIRTEKPVPMALMVTLAA
jgi:hypothetical protein